VANTFFTDEANLAELVSHMPEDDRNRFNNYGHFRVEAVFIDRIFIVYKPTGLTTSGRHKPPEILTTVKVTDFSADARYGCKATLVDQEHGGQELQVTHVPRRVFNYPVYVSIPARLNCAGTRASLAIGCGAACRSRSSSRPRTRATSIRKGMFTSRARTDFALSIRR
jgi:hypothetical protein